MTVEVLTICRNFLAEAYRKNLNLEFGNSISEIRKSNRPVWLMVSGDNLTSLQSNTSENAGLLLDPEIGLLAYVLPFKDGTDLRKQIKRALTLRSQLATERNYTGAITESSDGRGAWRIVLHWLVDEAKRDKWVKQIMLVRRETAYSEEVAMDAIFIAGGSVKEQIERYGFPRLLLTTREVLKKPRLDEMSKWLSANKLVEEALSSFASDFSKPEQIGYAKEVVRAMREFSAKGSGADDVDRAPANPHELKSIRIRNFRNFRDVRFDFDQAPVSASIVHGPNGTGKSSLCEALSISLFHSSFRYKWFSGKGEADVAVTNKADEYRTKYLTRIENPQLAPEIALNEHEFAAPQLVDADRADQVDLSMNGTILTQDSSLEFARMPSDQLGLRVLRGYSELADHLDQFTESRMNQANMLRQEFLRGLGVSAAIKKPDTAYERIAKREIDRALPPLPHSLVNWLESIASLPGRSAAELSQQWRAWGDPGRNALAKEFSVSNNNEGKLIKETRTWLNRFNDLASRSTEIVKGIEIRISPIRGEFESAIERVSTLGEWMERRTNDNSDLSASPEAVSLAKELQGLQTLQKDIVERGRSAGGHFDHLTTVAAFVRETWAKEHPSTCPTCGTNHAKQGGILKVIEVLRTQTTSERDRLRQEFSDTKVRIEEVQKRLAELGRAQCPLSAEEQSRLTEALQWLVPTNISLLEWISVKSQREALLQSISALRQIPEIPASIDVDSNTERVVKEILSLFQVANRTFEAPTNWKPVKDKLTQVLATIVNEHLPQTLERLWRELALNLTSAPWLLPDPFRINVVAQHGKKSLTVRVRGRLARYILNQAEIHTLGLAWFFTRHLTRGRFFQDCLVMDDPAHELDQTSFRDLCRLWETLLRLHRVYERPLKMVIMLNQESRAVEAARATGAILSVLGWDREQDQSVNAISVIGEGFHAPQPDALFATAGS